MRENVSKRRPPKQEILECFDASQVHKSLDFRVSKIRTRIQCLGALVTDCVTLGIRLNDPLLQTLEGAAAAVDAILSLFGNGRGPFEFLRAET